MTLISTSATIDETATIGRFCIVEDNVVIHENAIIGDYVLLKRNSVVGARTRIGPYCLIGEKATVGSDCSLTAYCEIRDDCSVGNRVVMGSRCTLSARTVVEDDVIMKYSFVVTDTPDLTKNDQKITGRLGRGSRFGANVVIMPGVSIGANAEIGACSQVRKDVPPNQVWFGLPAKYFRESE